MRTVRGRFRAAANLEVLLPSKFAVSLDAPLHILSTGGVFYGSTPSVFLSIYAAVRCCLVQRAVRAPEHPPAESSRDSVTTRWYHRYHREVPSPLGQQPPDFRKSCALRRRLARRSQREHDRVFHRSGHDRGTKSPRRFLWPSHDPECGSMDRHLQQSHNRLGQFYL